MAIEFDKHMTLYAIPFATRYCLHICIFGSDNFCIHIQFTYYILHIWHYLPRKCVASDFDSDIRCVTLMYNISTSK